MALRPHSAFVVAALVGEGAVVTETDDLSLNSRSETQLVVEDVRSPWLEHSALVEHTARFTVLAASYFGGKHKLPPMKSIALVGGEEDEQHLSSGVPCFQRCGMFPAVNYHSAEYRVPWQGVAVRGCPLCREH